MTMLSIFLFLLASTAHAWTQQAPDWAIKAFGPRNLQAHGTRPMLQHTIAPACAVKNPDGTSVPECKLAPAASWPAKVVGTGVVAPGFFCTEGPILNDMYMGAWVEYRPGYVSGSPNILAWTPWANWPAEIYCEKAIAAGLPGAGTVNRIEINITNEMDYNQFVYDSSNLTWPLPSIANLATTTTTLSLDSTWRAGANRASRLYTFNVPDANYVGGVYNGRNAANTADVLDTKCSIEPGNGDDVMTVWISENTPAAGNPDFVCVVSTTAGVVSLVKFNIVH